MSMTEPPETLPETEPPASDYVIEDGVRPEEPHLKRVIGFWGVTFYGLGGIIGAGIFATIGAISGRAGVFAPLAFLVAAVPAVFAALSYGELVRRLPKAGGEASYVHTAYNRLWLTRLTAGGVALSGVVSAATLATAFAGYFQAVAPVPAWIVMSVVVATAVVLAAMGVSLSTGVVVGVTVVEVGLLALIALVGSGEIAAWPSLAASTPAPPGLVLSLAASGVLAFFAFVGFEDVVNMAEEVKDAPRILPRALLTAFGIALILYIGVTATAVSVADPQALAASDEPLAVVAAAQGVLPGWLMTLLAMASISNGVIIQVNMVSRLLFGLAEYGGVPRALGHVSKRTRTPVNTVMLAGGLILIFALLIPLTQLAELTGVILLLVFALVQTALMVLLRREAADALRYIVPVAGVISALLLLIGAFV